MTRIYIEETGREYLVMKDDANGPPTMEMTYPYEFGGRRLAFDRAVGKAIELSPVGIHSFSTRAIHFRTEGNVFYPLEDYINKYHWVKGEWRER